VVVTIILSVAKDPGLISSNKQFLSLVFAAAFPISFFVIAQTKVEPEKPSRVIRCTIQTEQKEWKSTEPAVVTGQIENLVDGPLEVRVIPVLSLSTATSGDLPDGYWSPVDLLDDSPVSTDRLPSDPVITAITARRMLIQFKKKGDSIHFRFDARHTLWERQISSVWPSHQLFSVVKPGSYDLQLELETDEGNVESQKVKIQISKPRT
jgi:hypothetical protein